jgi:phosphorylcholine metabolism protein LicD
MKSKSIKDFGQKKANEFLQEVCEILTKYKIKYWLDFGTLLGIIRENRLLPHDMDLDISIDSKYLDTLRNIKDKFTENFHEWIDKEYGTTHFNIYKDNFCCSISVLRQDKNQVWCTGWDEENESMFQIYAPIRYFKKLDQINYKGFNYFIPNNSHKFLEYRYGKDWKIPNPNWDRKKAGGVT